MDTPIVGVARRDSGHLQGRRGQRSKRDLHAKKEGMRRSRFSGLRLLCVLVGTAVGWMVATPSAALPDAFRQEAIEKFIASRRQFDIKCLYTFDRFRPSINVSAPRAFKAARPIEPDDQMLVTIPPTFEEHIGPDCPFGDLQFDPELVTSLDDGKTTRQLGVHLAEDPRKDVKRPQIASNDVVPAKEFYTWATMLNRGISFEFTYRRRVETNQTMTLFSIGNPFGSCVDPGFRVDLISTHVIMINYFIPVLMENDIACYERRLFSARTNQCGLMPRYRPNIDDNPVVHVIVTVDASGGEGALRSGFFMKYVDPVTMETHVCRGYDAMPPPEEDIEPAYIQGTYRLYLGNNPRNVSNPLKRSKIAFVRQYRNPDWHDRSPEEKLRDMIKQKLDTLQGPRLPANFRLFGGQGVSMSVLGIDLPPVNEDTPFKWIRNQIEGFKEAHGDDIVEFIMKGLTEVEKSASFGFNSSLLGEGVVHGAAVDTSNSTDKAYQGLYPNANGSTFDMYHFAMYHKPTTVEEVEQTIWSSWMMPFRPFMALKRTIRIHEDEEVLLDLLQLHSIFDDIKLEIVQLPEHGVLLLHPNKTALTDANVKFFRELPVQQQQKVFFVPNPHENQKNIRNGGPTRQFEPYSVIRFRTWKSTTGRIINDTREGMIEIWVDPVDDAPRAQQVVDVDVYSTKPVYIDLKGFDGSDASLKTEKLANSRPNSRRLGLFSELGQLAGMVGIPLPTSRTVTSANVSQNIRILDLPRFGHLYDRRMEDVAERLTGADVLDPNDLEPYRIRREWIATRSFSTSLVYFFDRESVEIATGCVDYLRYQVRVGSSSQYSANSTIKFHLHTPSAVSDNSIENESVLAGVYQVEEDSAITLALLEIESFQQDPSIRFKVEQLPRHGKLYQYLPRESAQLSPSQASLGPLIQTGAMHIDDISGRLVYVPDPNYFNAVPGDQEDEFGVLDNSFDWFSFSVSAHGAVSDPITTRIVRLRVLSTPDALSILPPTVISTNCTRGEPVRVPVIFDDPDGFLGTYRVVLEANDGVSTFEFGHIITDDDLLKYCPLKRPCNLIRSANDSFVSNENGDNDEKTEWQLLYHVKSQSWNPSKIDVQGLKTAIEYSLQRLIYRDMSKWTWYSDHTSRFDITIERLNSSTKAKIKTTYYVDFEPAGTDEDRDSLGHALSNLANLVSMGVWMAVVCFLLSSASCCSTGFCCCCTRARREKRQRLEEDHRRYVDQVVQNNHEYSVLLKMLVDILADHDLLLTETLLRICRGSNESERSLMEALCLKSLTPILDAEDKFFNLAMHLISDECHNQLYTPVRAMLAYPSLASMTLAHFCNEKGGDWLQHFRRAILADEVPMHIDGTTQLIDALELVIIKRKLPVEIIRICRTFADSVSTISGEDRTVAIHIVFFNHFIGPNLWYVKRDAKGKRMTRSKQRKLRAALQVLASYGWQNQVCESLSQDDEDVLARYKSILQGISASSVKQDPEREAVVIDSDFMGACLMNLHSILERVLPALEADEKVREAAQEDSSHPIQNDDDVSGELDTTAVAEIKRLLHALNFPLASFEALVAIASASTIADDPLLWNGFSVDEWRERVCEAKSTKRAKRSSRKLPNLRHSDSLLAVDIADEEDTSSASFEFSSSDKSGCLRGVEFEF
jgi:hypothetical protein